MIRQQIYQIPRTVARLAEWAIALLKFIGRLVQAFVILVIGLALTAGWAIPSLLSLYNLVTGQFIAAWHMLILGAVIFLLYRIFLLLLDNIVDTDLEEAISELKKETSRILWRKYN